MLRIRVQLDSTGLLTGVSAKGHAGFAPKGTDIVCAAASVLLRTVARTFETAAGFQIDGGTEKRGELELSVSAADDADADWGRGVTEMFVRGIDDLSQEFPEHIKLTISND